MSEIIIQRSWRASRYRLTLRRDGTAVATIPLHGSERAAREFIESNTDWLERARARQQRRPQLAEAWPLGTHVLWRGELTEIRSAVAADPAGWGDAASPSVCLAADVFRLSTLEGDLRAELEEHFLCLAKVELPARAWELAARTNADLRQISVRNQRSRWGSCSHNGTVSLNWRLVQTPDSVRDYIIYHELAHLREMNHSDRFWAQVEAMCPSWRDAERWIKQHGSLLGL